MEQFRIPQPYTLKAEAEATGKMTWRSNQDSTVVTGQRLHFALDAKGVVTSYRVDGREYIHEGFGFQPNFWRAPTDNDNGNNTAERLRIWKTASQEFHPTVRVSHQGTQTVVVINYTLPTGNHYTLTYTLSDDGRLHVAADYTPASKADTPELPRVGLRFRLPAAMDGVTYFGRGLRKTTSIATTAPPSGATRPRPTISTIPTSAPRRTVITPTCAGSDWRTTSATDSSSRQTV